MDQRVLWMEHGLVGRVLDGLHGGELMQRKGTLLQAGQCGGLLLSRVGTRSRSTITPSSTATATSSSAATAMGGWQLVVLIVGHGCRGGCRMVQMHDIREI